MPYTCRNSSADGTPQTLLQPLPHPASSRRCPAQGSRSSARHVQAVLSPPGHASPGGGSHSSCIKAGMQARVTLSCPKAACEGPRSIPSVCGRVSSQDELRSAICAPSSAWLVPAGLLVTQQHLSTCKRPRPLLRTGRSFRPSGSPTVAPGLPSDTLEAAAVTGPGPGQGVCGTGWEVWPG